MELLSFILYISMIFIFAIILVLYDSVSLKKRSKLENEIKELKITHDAELHKCSILYSKRLEDVESKWEDAESKCLTLNKQLSETKGILKSLKSEYRQLSEEYAHDELLLNNIESDYKKLIESNVTAMPWLAGMMGDFMTYELEHMAKGLEWGYDQQRLKKVASIRDIRAEAAHFVAQGKEAIYQLEYLRALFPNIDDYLETDYKDIFVQEDISDFDPVRKYLSKEEWSSMSDTAKNQLALDRYIKQQKSKWQIGRDYELSVAYEYSQNGYYVDTYGSYMQFEDHGRDLIAKKGEEICIIQCKYWSNSKVIHEKHIYQLYGTVVSFCIENRNTASNVKGVFVTNIKLTPFARQAAKYLNITVVENHEFVEFPRIKCNIGKDEFGLTTYIYHLPMDAMYDRVKICKKGEFYAFTVKEAEKAGFRRAYRWHGNG